MILVNLLFWGPIPALSLWIASQVQYHTDSVSLGILLGFVALLALLFGGLALLKGIDRFWILARRAAGHDQRQGVLGRVFATTAVIGTVGFTFWLLFIGGGGPPPAAPPCFPPNPRKQGWTNKEGGANPRRAAPRRSHKTPP